MAEISKDLGMFAVLAKRMVEERLPKALALKERVERGEKLGDLDMEFLEEVVRGARELLPKVKENPQAESVAARMLQLYAEITEKALANEKSGKAS